MALTSMIGRGDQRARIITHVGGDNVATSPAITTPLRACATLYGRLQPFTALYGSLRPRARRRQPARQLPVLRLGVGLRADAALPGHLERRTADGVDHSGDPVLLAVRAVEVDH